MNLQDQIKHNLSSIGFTALESDIYIYLITNNESTGYAIAKGISKPVANVYKAVESLAIKGAIEHAVMDSKLFAAIPWQQFLSSQHKNFTDNIDSLSECLKKLPIQKQDEQVYQLRNLKQVVDQSIRIIDESKSFLLANIEPKALGLLKDALVNAAARGVEVRVKLYEPADLEGIKITLRHHGKEIYNKTEDINFSLCSDGKEMMMALLTTDKTEVIQAFRSRSALMTLMLHNKLLYELVLTELKEVIPLGQLEQAQSILEETAHLHPFSQSNAVFESFNQSYERYRK